MKHSILFLFAFLLPVLSFADPIKDRNASLDALSPEKKVLYQQLADTWSPQFFTGSIEKSLIRRIESIKPMNMIVSPDFDGDEDWSNNKENIEKIKKNPDGSESSQFPIVAKIPTLIQETDTHYYITYYVYHAMDSGHAQDGEHVISVIKKSETDPMGEKDFDITIKHRTAAIYAADEARETALRNNYRGVLLKRKNASFAKEALDQFDSEAKDHHFEGRPEYVMVDGKPRGLKVFVCPDTHALSKCNTGIWMKEEAGFTYVCESAGRETVADCKKVPVKGQRKLNYSVMQFGEFYSGLYPRDLDALTGPEHAKLLAKQATMFEDRQGALIISEENGKVVTGPMTVADGKIQPRPTGDTLVRGKGESKAEANLFGGFGLAGRQSVPHMFVRALDPQNAEKVSDHYIYNPLIEYTELKPVEEKKSSQAPAAGSSIEIAGNDCPEAGPVTSLLDSVTKQ